MIICPQASSSLITTSAQIGSNNISKSQVDQTVFQNPKWIKQYFKIPSGSNSISK